MKGFSEKEPSQKKIYNVEFSLIPKKIIKKPHFPDDSGIFHYF